MEPAPEIKKKRGISPIWILPIIALCICAWIFYSSYQSAGVKITIFFEDASGITPGKTQVISRGLPVGTVTDIHPDIENRRIQTVVKMDSIMEKHLVEDTQFWVVRPEISAASVQGLDTLLSGSYIGIQTGHSEDSSRRFIGLSSPPAISEEAPGLHLRLSADALGSIQVGSGVYYRNIKIGSIAKHSLQQDDSILINLHIEPDYTHLVREGSRFFNASGLDISGKLTNLKVHVESIASLIKGGIVLHTPEALIDTPQVSNGHLFQLYKDLDSAKYGINMTLQLASSAGITEKETKVMYRGLVAGIVEKIEFNEDERHTVTAHIMLDPRADRILRQETQFWIVQPSVTMQGVENINTLFSGPHITFQPGGGDFRNHFQILPEPPPQKPLRAGVEILLTASESYSINRGASVTYKNKKVGEVLSVELDATLRDFEVLIFIYQQYEKLVQPHSIFWNAGGVSLDADFTGIHVKANSLQTMLSGEIAFFTPEVSQKDTKDSAKNRHIVLHKNYNDAVAATPALQPRGYHFRLQADETFTVGTPLYFRKVKVGQVLGFNLSDDRSSVYIDCLIEEPYTDTVNASSRFFALNGVTIEGSLSGVSVNTESLESILRGGIGFITPQPGPAAPKPFTFPMYSSREAAESAEDVFITVMFKQCKDLKKGAAVKYKGIHIGEVRDLNFAENMEDVLVHLRIQKKAAPLFRNRTKIWLEKAEVSLSGVRNPGTILFGSYINVLPGTGAPKKNFTALLRPPAASADMPEGLDIILVSSNLGSLKTGSPVFYRRLQVGKVAQHRLSEDFKHILIYVTIEQRYAPIIRKNTRFWNASGAKVEGGLFSGLTVTTESLETILSGGIALATPEENEMGGPVENNHLFILHDDAEDNWLDWQPDIILVQEEMSATPDI